MEISNELDVNMMLFEVHLSEEHLFPAMLDMLWLEFEKYKVALCGDDLFGYVKKLLLTLFAALNTVLGLYEFDKLLLTHCAVSTVLPALIVLDLYESSVEEELILIASADTFLVQ
jgi:hypothetical protein